MHDSRENVILIFTLKVPYITELAEIVRTKNSKNNIMRTVQIKVSETDFQKYDVGSGEIKFTNLVEAIKREYARQALLECNEIAEKVGLSKMTIDEINAEIKSVRDAKTHS